jgi:putative ATP-dependent endonuclease of OLD family
LDATSASVSRAVSKIKVDAMAAVRFLRISNFRGIAAMEWAPDPGLNAIIGPGDTAKSTILDALDLVLGTRRGSFTEVDFHRLNLDDPIIIDVTVGDLPQAILDLEAYSSAIRGWNDFWEEVNDEPGDGDEPVITIRLVVAADEEPTWCLHSDRLANSGLPRDIRSAHRALISSVRLGTFASQHLAWGPRSVLSRLSDEGGRTGDALAAATKAARESFEPGKVLGLRPAVAAARKVAHDMAVAGALSADAALDARAVSIGSGAVALHNEGIPLRALGLGSSRLMAAGLQAAAAASVPIVLFDEIEQGLEPHRITRLLHRLGSKAQSPPQQVFLTTHSPCVLRELSAKQLWKAQRNAGVLKLQRCPTESQGTLRSHPEAFLSPAILVCEGATEVGLLRGLDIYDAERGRETLALMGIALVDGGGIPKAAATAVQFAKLGFRTGLLRDSDKTAPTEEAEIEKLGGKIFCWDAGFTTEDQLFASIPIAALSLMLDIADQHRSPERVDSNLSSVRLNKEAIARLRSAPTEDHRVLLAEAANTGEWYKRIDIAEDVGRVVVGPHAPLLDGGLESTLESLWQWIADDP